MDVDVVVTHYEDPQRLAWVLDALAAQTHPAERLHVVVADDGSRVAPPVPDGVRLLSQADEGFRAAAARNLGASAGRAPFVLFLDGDTVPEPGYVAAMVAAWQGADDGHGALVVGRRRHGDLSGVCAASRSVPHWVSNPAERVSEDLLDEPRWLRDGYERAGDLAHAGPDDWRLVISAVMGMTRCAFEALGGFDASLVGYGGEDWELAYRAWNAGVVLRHAPTAVAWHDGPDAGVRENAADLRRIKAGEQLALAPRIPQPLVRGRHGTWQVPRVLVRCSLRGLEATATHALIESWLALADVGVWLDERPQGLLAEDPRVRSGRANEDVLARAEFVVDLDAPVVLLDASAFWVACAGQPREGLGVAAARTRHRRRGVAAAPWPSGVVAALGAADPAGGDGGGDGGPLDLESWGRRWWA